MSEQINTTCQASLVSHQTEKTFLFGSVTGYIGGLIEISNEMNYLVANLSFP